MSFLFIKLFGVDFVLFLSQWRGLFFIFKEKKYLKLFSWRSCFILFYFNLFILGCSPLQTREEINKKINNKSKININEIKAKDVNKSKDIEKASELSLETDSILKIPKVALILGAGGAKAIAHLGVIHELEKARIPIDNIIGIEWGSFIGGAYARNTKIRELEWEVNKIKKKDVFPLKSLFETKIKGMPVENFLNKSLSKEAQSTLIRDFDLDFSCPSLSVNSGKLRWLNKGKLSVVLSRCLAFPPLFKPSKLWVAATFSLKEAVKKLKKEGVDIIIISHVLGTGNLETKKEKNRMTFSQRLLWKELRNLSERDLKDLAEKENIEILKVKTNQYSIFSFDKIGPLILSGQRSGRKLVKKLIDKYNF